MMLRGGIEARSHRLDTRSVRRSASNDVHERLDSRDLFTDWDIPWVVTVGARADRGRFTCGDGCAFGARGPRSFRRGGSAAFLGGIVALFVAVASPLDTFSESLLFMHMAQHFVLMSIAPPLIVLGAPVVPMLRGLPRLVIRVLRPLFVTRPAASRLEHFSRARAWPGSR